MSQQVSELPSPSRLDNILPRGHTIFVYPLHCCYGSVFLAKDKILSTRSVSHLGCYCGVLPHPGGFSPCLRPGKHNMEIRGYCKDLISQKFPIFQETILKRGRPQNTSWINGNGHLFQALILFQIQKHVPTVKNCLWEGRSQGAYRSCSHSSLFFSMKSVLSLQCRTEKCGHLLDTRRSAALEPWKSLSVECAHFR